MLDRPLARVYLHETGAYERPFRCPRVVPVWFRSGGLAANPYGNTNLVLVGVVLHEEVSLTS